MARRRKTRRTATKRTAARRSKGRTAGVARSRALGGVDRYFPAIMVGALLVGAAFALLG